MKEMYEDLELEIYNFAEEDIIVCSGTGTTTGDDETGDGTSF